MKRIIDHLTKPRFVIIADYPFSPYKIGDIAESTNGESIKMTVTSYRDEFGETQNVAQYNYPDTFRKYPVLFKELRWFEFRKEEEMPMYLKFVDKNKDGIFEPTDYYKIKKWEYHNYFGLTSTMEREGCSLMTWAHPYGYFPCSEEEYLSFKTKGEK